MDRNEKLDRLRKLMKQIAPEGSVESLARAPASESLPGPEVLEVAGVDEETERAHACVRKIAHDEPNDRFDDTEIGVLEAIVMPRERPVAFIEDGRFGAMPDPWVHFGSGAIRDRITRAIPAIGRVELPENNWLPYGGTGFAVGPNLLMTNRHVAELFSEGVGRQGLVFRSGQSAALNFRRENGDADDDQSAFARVQKVVMIHPFWDMALLRVDELPDDVSPLKLSVLDPEELCGREIALVGYPARDERSNLELQDRIFQRTYNIKRLQPGKIRERDSIRSFGNIVSAVTHDSSTLGGNSGSAIIDVTTGEIVGLHFAGIYLEANYAVPTFELARDSRVVDAGVSFADEITPAGDWDYVWRRADPDEAAPIPRDTTPVPNAADGRIALVQGHVATWTIPLQVSVTLRAPMSTGVPQGADGATPTGVDLFEAMRVPIIHGNLESRAGYQPGFLDLEDDEIPLPELTEAGRRIAAKLDDGMTEIRYHKFSIVMHKKRRLALLTAANVDFRDTSRQVNGHTPTRKELTGLGQHDREKWTTDPRIPDAHQLPDIFFTKDGGAFDKGHLVRRVDVCWGSSFEDIQMANGDTYHTTNCSPQISSFNQSSRGVDNWGDLEYLVQKQTKSEKAMVFSGPVLADDDPLFAGRDMRGDVRVQIPRKFWKIIVTKGEAGPEAYGFTLEQDLAAVPTEFVVPSEWKRHMRKISDIESLLNGLVDISCLKQIDQFGLDEAREIAESVRAR